MATRLLLCIISLGLLIESSFAQITYDGCTDFRGIPVASILSYGINDVAVASLAPNGAPVVQYNPAVLSFFRPQTRLFWYAHECGHHALGHAFGTAHPMAREQQADCWGISALVREGGFDIDDVRIVQQDLSRLPSGDWTHLPGPQRAINLQACLGTSSTDSDSPLERCQTRCDTRRDRCQESCEGNACDRCESRYDTCQERCGRTYAY